MKYNLDDTVYTIDEYRIKIEKHKVESVFVKRLKGLEGPAQLVQYGFIGESSKVEEKDVFTKEEAQLELLQRVKQRHAGDIAQVKRTSEAL